MPILMLWLTRVTPLASVGTASNARVYRSSGGKTDCVGAVQITVPKMLSCGLWVWRCVVVATSHNFGIPRPLRIFMALPAVEHAAHIVHAFTQVIK